MARAGWLKATELVEPVGRDRGRGPGEVGLAAVVAGGRCGARSYHGGSPRCSPCRSTQGGRPRSWSTRRTRGCPSGGGGGGTSGQRVSVGGGVRRREEGMADGRVARGRGRTRHPAVLAAQSRLKRSRGIRRAPRAVAVCSLNAPCPWPRLCWRSWQARPCSRRAPWWRGRGQAHGETTAAVVAPASVVTAAVAEGGGGGGGGTVTVSNVRSYPNLRWKRNVCGKGRGMKGRERGKPRLRGASGR